MSRSPGWLVFRRCLSLPPSSSFPASETCEGRVQGVRAGRVRPGSEGTRIMSAVGLRGDAHCRYNRVQRELTGRVRPGSGGTAGSETTHGRGGVQGSEATHGRGGVQGSEATHGRGGVQGSVETRKKDSDRTSRAGSEETRGWVLKGHARRVPSAGEGMHTCTRSESRRPRLPTARTASSAISPPSRAVRLG
ncbi:hypothetical protein T492DRAFT_1144287 [Pavlovales sp. CCMP2436]|nr:hypothetical protein T492DRAFT_1144287 [Pavlovales sp. CCMP2436]